MQWDGTETGAAPIIAWIADHGEGTDARYEHIDTTGDGTEWRDYLDVRTPNATTSARPDWWIVRHENGEFAAVGPGTFALHYTIQRWTDA